MDLKDSNENTYVHGIPLLIGALLFTKYKYEGVPTGEAFMLNLENQYEDADEDTLGENVLMLYNEDV